MDEPEPRAELQPELWVDDGAAAIAFYERGFGASVDYLLKGPEPTDVVAQLSVGGARFWLSTASEELRRFSPDSIGGATGRVLLVIADPDALAASALGAGATLLSEVGEEHGWRLGRLRDPFGHEWEIGHPLGSWPPGA
jgi:PhnB protein